MYLRLSIIYEIQWMYTRNTSEGTTICHIPCLPLLENTFIYF